jgi:LEA14-like dessication related protein
MKQRIVTLFFATLVATSCGTLGDSLKGAINMAQCQYSYNSLSNLSLGGINLSGGNALSFTNIAKLTSILTGSAKSIPMNFTVNLDVKNPNSAVAALSGLRYNLKIDGINFTNGNLEQAINIPSGGTQVLPLTVGLDLATLMAGDSRNSIVNIVKNFIGMGSEKTNVSLELYPAVSFGGIPLQSPVAIPVSFSFGGK